MNLLTWISHPAVLVGLGGALGSNARFWLGRWFREQPWAQDFYWGTLLINITGSILLGVIAILFRDRIGPGFLLLGTGFCGGYTTFSTFSLEVIDLMQKNRWDLAFGYVASSLVLGFLGFFLAWKMTQAVVGTPN